MSGPDSPLLNWLGQRVTVVIDRPLGSRHPRHRDVVYPVNYGYIPGTMAKDGHPTDAYVLGMKTPIERVDGDVIAVVVRHNEVEGKLVVVPTDQRFTRGDIANAVRFQEQYFETEIVMRDDR